MRAVNRIYTHIYPDGYVFLSIDSKRYVAELDYKINEFMFLKVEVCGL